MHPEGGRAFCRLLWSGAPSFPSALSSAHQPQRHALRVPVANASGLLLRRKLLHVRQLPPQPNPPPPTTTEAPSTTFETCTPLRTMSLVPRLNRGEIVL